MAVAEKAAPLAVVVTADEALLDQVLVVGAAAGLELEVLPDAGALRPVWSVATVVVVGADQAAAVVAMLLPRRVDTYVVGLDGAAEVVHAWSVPLGAPVVSLPSGMRWLSEALANATGARTGRGRLLAVVGGSGGAGASTFAAGLAVVAAQRRQRCLLIDGDPLGGGLDLLIGAEEVPGWRWPRLSGAQGQLGDLSGQLPQVDGVEVLSMSRGDRSEPGGEAMKAVLLSASRSHHLVVVDLPRNSGPGCQEVLRRADAVVVAAVTDLRSMAAAAALLEHLAEWCAPTGLVVRMSRPRTVSAGTVAEGLGLPLLAQVRDDPRLRTGSERGDPPGRTPRSPLAVACRVVLDRPELTERPAA